jgi:hypothetical protein
MTDSLSEDWDFQAEAAREFDEACRDSGYTVWDGGPYGVFASSVLTSEDPKAAAAELEQLLDRWPERTPATPHP